MTIPLSFNGIFLSVFAAEACVPFFEVYASVLSGSRVWLYHELQSFDATAEEKVALEKIQGCYREERLRNILLEPKIMVNFCLPPVTHATDAVRLCIRDKYNHYCMSGELQLRTETLAHPNTCKAACHVHSLPVPYTILQFTPTWWVNMPFSHIIRTVESFDGLCTGLVPPALL